MAECSTSKVDDGAATELSVGSRIEVAWPCEADSVAVDGFASAPSPAAAVEPERRTIWFTAEVVAERATARGAKKFLLRFDDDGSEAWNSLRKLPWRLLPAAPIATEQSRTPVEEAVENVAAEKCAEGEEEVHDATGFVHLFELDEHLLDFCDELHERREELGDKTRGDSAYGEPLHGGLVSVVVRRDALPPRERDLYLALHQRCIEQVSVAWPQWLRQAGGRGARARPSQDLRLLQYTAGANFKKHVDSGWACQALVYLNEDFRGGGTEFPNLKASYRPRRGRVLLWRSVCVGHRAAVPGSLDDHPAAHMAGEVSNGTKRVVSLHLVLA